MTGVFTHDARALGVRLTCRDQIAFLARLRGGEREALEEAANLHGPRLLRLAHRLLSWNGHGGEADDVVQEVFARMLARPDRIAPGGNLEAWLVVVTVNECRSHGRKLRALLKALRKAPAPEFEVAANADAMRLELHAGVRRAVGRLPQRDREVIVLHYLEQMPVNEVAAALGLKRNAVEVRLHRARGRLKKLLADLT